MLRLQRASICHWDNIAKLHLSQAKPAQKVTEPGNLHASMLQDSPRMNGKSSRRLTPTGCVRNVAQLAGRLINREAHDRVMPTIGPIQKFAAKSRQTIHVGTLSDFVVNAFCRSSANETAC